MDKCVTCNKRFHCYCLTCAIRGHCEKYDCWTGQTVEFCPEHVSEDKEKKF